MFELGDALLLRAVSCALYPENWAKLGVDPRPVMQFGSSSTWISEAAARTR
jgi:hypothetical protein